MSAVTVAVPAATPTSASASASAARQYARSTGAVADSGSPVASLWIPEATPAAYTLAYATTDAFGNTTHSTGTVFIPKGRAPVDGWPVISWAHGIQGPGDGDGGSAHVGPVDPERDLACLRRWVEEEYAVVASDHACLGAPGLHTYVDGMTAARHNVDIVRAARSFASQHLPPAMRLAPQWVAIGQSQGASAAIHTARYATRLSGGELDYRGAVGTGTPANIDKLLALFGPDLPPEPLVGATRAYLAYTLAALRYVRPELGLDGILTAEGRRYLRMATAVGYEEFKQRVGGASLENWFTRPIATLPRFRETLSDHMAMPTCGFDKPVFMAHGLMDTDAPFVATAGYAATLRHNGQPVTFKTYASDHNGTMGASLQDTMPFVAQLFRH